MTISDFWPVTIWYFKPGLWLGWAGQVDWARLGWAGQTLARWAGRAGRHPNWAGLAELSEQWQVMVNGGSRPLVY